MSEGPYKTKLIKKLERLFPGCIILKNDPEYRPGIPDLSIFYENQWAALEVKTSATAAEQPNQDWYVERMNEMSFAAFIYPENEREVLDDLQQAFGTRRNSRVSKR